jgi:REP element-mobilizing transposase RayT
MAMLREKIVDISTIAPKHPGHVTLSVLPGLPSPRDGEVAREVERAFRRGCERKGMRLVHYSIQDDHVHLIVDADGVQALGNGMKSLASLFAFAVNRALERPKGKVLQGSLPPARAEEPAAGAQRDRLRWRSRARGSCKGAGHDRPPPLTR